MTMTDVSEPAILNHWSATVVSGFLGLGFLIQSRDADSRSAFDWTAGRLRFWCTDIGVAAF
jgi:hypothetical protein